MKNIVKEILNQIQEDKEKRRRSRAVLLVMSLFVASGVLWQLKITGITMTGEALCGYLEHQHTAECLGMKLVCGKEETAGHRHEDACYQQLICEDAEHNHEDQCYVTAEQPVCGLEEADSHIHDDSCKKEGYVCGYETEHVHDLLCYSDLEADLETSSDWEKTIPALSREPAEDLAMVARTQIGYAESARNYKVGEDGSTKQGYTRYGEWYGNPYGDWNAMFVSFCLRYAEHPAYETLKNSGVETMRVSADRAGVYQAAAGTTPYVGDLAFLDKDSNGNCDTVAVVTGRQEGSMTVVEGDCGGVVAENQYSLDNGTILGYALLTAQPATLEENAEEEIVEVDDVIANEAKNGDVVPAADGNITISFVINDTKYTDDNGLTHVVANLTEKNNPSADGYSTDGGLTYTYWTTEGGKYKTKITGTGTLMTRTIPVGTTLSGSGYSLPSISITNITGSESSYGSSYSWVTDSGMICNDKTEFTEDTTLYLYLYETGTSCGLNWVCNCDNGGSHSITYYVSGFASPTFIWGQSVSAPYIPTAEAVNSMYTGSQYCTAGPDHGMQFKGWYVKDTEGNEIDFAAGLPILQSYVDTNSSGYSVKVYARWEEVAAPVTVTATFVNGENQTTETLNSGDALGDKLPAVTAPDGQIFLGWKIGDTDAYATAETVIEADTTYTAVFVNKVTVSFVNGETTVETRELAENAVLGALPQAPEAAENQVFLGWQAEGAEGYATAETVITTDTTFHAAFATNVTVTFMNGQTQYGEVVKVPQGALVWKYLPETEPEYPGTSETPMTFSGWGWTVDNEVHMVTEETVVEADMVLYAVFEEVTGYEIYLHDMAPDGKTDYETDEQDVQVSQTYLSVGMNLAEELEENPYYMVHDDALASECIWYIKQADGTYAPYDLGTEVTSDLHLYTFNYSVTLTREEATATASFLDLFAVASAVEIDVSDDGNTLTLTLREGEKPTAADFVVNGVDYTLYTWTYTDSNDEEQTLNISDIIANGVTENITATSDGTMSELTTASMNIHFFACINDKWTEVETINSMTVYTIDSYRYYLTPAQLETIYGAYGYSADGYTVNNHFFLHERHNDNGVTNIWTATQAVTTREGSVLIPLLTDTGECDVYYLPGNTTAYDHGTTVAGLGNQYSFYTVTVLDPNNLIYSEEEEVPAVQYVLTGGEATVTLKVPSGDNGAYWLVNGVDLDQMPADNANFDFIDNGDGTYTFTNITGEILISAYVENLFDISYDINLGSYSPTSTVPTINGADTYTEAVQVKEDGSYVILTPSRTRFTVDAGSALRTVVFTGWAVDGDTTRILNAGDSLSGTELKAYGSVLKLVAQWKQMEDDHSVSFYINLELQVADYAGNTNATPTSNYTAALYGTEVVISPCPQCDGGSALESETIIEAENQSATAAVDAQVRELVNGVTATYMDEERNFTLGSFPNDEAMLAAIREKQAEYIAAFQKSADYSASDPTNVVQYRNNNNKIICTEDANGVLRYIPVDELTSEHYTIRWYVFKFDYTDGWHVDGVLVKKQGIMTITKTFNGDTAAIEEVKENNFVIDVMGVKEASGHQDFLYTLTLKSEADQSDDTTTEQTEQGYRSYDAATDTYTWVITLTADWEAYVHERNYVCTNSEIATVAEYISSNFSDASMNTNGKVHYTDAIHTAGVEVAAKAHSVDQDYRTYETVAFTNSYIPTAAVPISKVDDYGNPLPGVAFTLYKDGEKCNIYLDESTGTYYIYEPTGIDVSKVESGLITVNNQGYAMVMGLKEVDANGKYSNYTFKLEETVAPEGYTPISDINFTIADDGSIQLIGTTTSAATINGDVIRVTNASRTMGVTAVKQWIGDQKQEVQVQLTLNGNPLTDKTATLSDANNWTYTWEDMPIYVGGALAEYSIKETWIGNTAYNGSYADGYENYIVTVTDPAVVNGTDGLPQSATITVTNQVYEGGLVFVKVDENGNALSGAGFQLFTDENCETEYGIGEISDLYGNVNFGSLAAGTYYMKEVRTPAGYQDNDTVYKIVVSGNGTVITDMTTQKNVTAIENIQATASLKVQKVDGSSNALSGAVFEVYMKNGEGVYEKVTRTVDGVSRNQFPVDSSGKLTVPDLMPGDYKLVEVSAPAGYYRMTEEIEFNVALAKIVALDVRTDENGNRVEDTTNSWSFDGETITVVNVTGSELPQTGGIGTHYGTMAGLLMMLSSLLYGFLLRRKRERGAV